MTTREELQALYEKRFDKALKPLAEGLQRLLYDLVKDYPRIDRVSVRAKSVDRFLDKAFKTDEGKLKYTDPINEIEDQVAARIVIFYLDDIEKVCQIVKDYFGAIEELKIVPTEANQFDYEGRHFTLFIPDDLKTGDILPELCPKFFELQIKTLFQHAWGEANHDIAYKPRVKPSKDQVRLVAYAAAQAWGADQIFNQLSTELLPAD